MSEVTLVPLLLGSDGRCDYCGEKKPRKSTITSTEYEGTAFACAACTFELSPDRKDWERIPLPVLLWVRGMKLKDIEWWDAPLLRPADDEDAYLYGTTKLQMVNENAEGNCCYAGIFAAPMGKHIVYWYQQQKSKESSADRKNGTTAGTT